MCPYPKQVEKEATGRRVSKLTGNESANSKGRKEKIVELHQELQQAEFMDAVENAASTM